MKHKQTLVGEIRYIVLLAVLIIGLAAIVGCGDGDDDDGVGDEVKLPPKLKGVFVDSPVQGLNYETDTLAGTTDKNGTFIYREGETIKFFLANVSLGEDTPAMPVMSPRDLITFAKDETHESVINISRLLQSLDEDGDLENGIQINERTRNQVRDMEIYFNVSPIKFTNDEDIQNLMTTLNALEVFTANKPRTLRTEEEALAHLRESLGIEVEDEEDQGD